MLGLSSALMDVLLTGTRFKPAAAQELGLVDELVASMDGLVTAAKAWVLEHRDEADDPSGAAVQPWDRPGYKMPGGTPSSPKLAAFLPAFPANLRKQTKGANYPAPRAILAAAVEGAQVDFDTASRIESRYLTKLIVGQNSKNMIQAFFFDLQAINSGALRPEGVERFHATKVGVLGAGMMGAGIAYSAARAGMEVVLKDAELEKAETGKAYSATLLDKAVSRDKMTPEKRDEILARIRPTADPADLAGCDTVIEAVFEDPSLKAKVFAEMQDVVNPDALLGSNTSTLPISELAGGVSRPEDFIGLHFFSPVDKMPLVEIIKGEKTSPETVARAIDVVQQIRKTPIVVNDSRGFFTSPGHRHAGQRGDRAARGGRRPADHRARRDDGRLPGPAARDARRGLADLEPEHPQGHRGGRRPRRHRPPRAARHRDHRPDGRGVRPVGQGGRLRVLRLPVC